MADYRNNQGHMVTRDEFEAEINDLGNVFLANLYKLGKARPDEAIQGFAFDGGGAYPVTSEGVGPGIAVFFASDLHDLTAEKLYALFTSSEAYDVHGALCEVLLHAVVGFRAKAKDCNNAHVREHHVALDDALVTLFFAMREERRATGI